MSRMSGGYPITRYWSRMAGPLAIAAIVLGMSPLSAQQFSAQLTRRSSDGQTATGRIVVSDDKVRIETPDFPDSFFLIRRDKSAVYLVRPKRHEFMDARQSSALTDILVPVDPDTPCQQLQAMADISQIVRDEPSWQCQLVGRETIDHRQTLHYRISSSPDRQYGVWVDPQIRFVVRLTAADGTTLTLDDIQEGAQPEAAFEIPAGLRKFDPAQLIERIKRSDAWVEPTR